LCAQIVFVKTFVVIRNIFSW